MKVLPRTIEQVRDHFTARAPGYDASSRWCTDPGIANRCRELLAPAPAHHLLDVACGTGLVARLFHGSVARVVGVDVTSAMFEQAGPFLDEMVVSPGESLPFPADTFDRVICRQGIQFMDVAPALAEMVRVTRPGGRILLVDLCAYGEEDREEYFEILRLRNPARRNFFRRRDVQRLLQEAGCGRVEHYEYVSVEDVDVWSDNGAIDEARRERIREIYRNASPAFRRRHSVTREDGRIVDHMLFGLTLGHV